MSDTLEQLGTGWKRISQERIEELADYYDRTDTVDLEGEEVDPGVIDLYGEMEEVSIQLPRRELELLKRQAERSGAHYATLLRMIVRAHLNNPLTYHPGVKQAKET